MDQSVYHIPALLQPTLDALAIEPDGTYVDVTYGGGGHSRAILQLLSPQGRLFSMDQDIEAIERGLRWIEADAEADKHGKLNLILGNFRFMANFLRYNGVEKGSVDGILADLGVSFHHFDSPERGFSFRYDAPLDMRMNQKAPLTAAQLIERAAEEQLADIFYLYGEMKNARKLASALVKARAKEAITTTGQLLEVVKPFINPKQEKKELAQIFQALRIEVNGELEALKSFLKQAVEMLAPGGRLAVITYHSLEDRLVKNFMKTGNFEGKPDRDFYGRDNAPMKPLSSKAIAPTDDEIESNPRSRSAKLRAAEKI